MLEYCQAGEAQRQAWRAALRAKVAEDFNVDRIKVQIREAIETAFKVDVVKINLINVQGKIKRLGRFAGRRPERKKAIVTLKAGQRIEQLEGLS